MPSWKHRLGPQYIWDDQPTRTETVYTAIQGNGVTITETVPEELTAALREAAQGTIARWTELSGDEGTSLLSDFGV